MQRLLFVGILLSRIAVGDPLTVIFHGIGSGTLGSETFTSSAFTFTFTSDTSLLTTQLAWPNDISTPEGTPASFTIDAIGSGSLTDGQAVFVNPTTDDVGIWIFSPPDFLTLGNSAFAIYDLSTNLGPINGTPSATSAFLPTSIGNNELLSFTSVSNLTFTAAVGAHSVPEPSTLGMVGLALGCLVVGKARRNLSGAQRS